MKETVVTGKDKSEQNAFLPKIDAMVSKTKEDTNQAEMTNDDWVERLIHVGEGNISVSFPKSEAGHGIMNTFMLSGTPLELKKGIYLDLTSAEEINATTVGHDELHNPGVGVYTFGGGLILDGKNLQEKGEKYAELFGISITGEWSVPENEVWGGVSTLPASENTMLHADIKEQVMGLLPDLNIALKGGAVDQQPGSPVVIANFNYATIQQDGKDVSKEFSVPADDIGIPKEGVVLNKTDLNFDKLGYMMQFDQGDVNQVKLETDKEGTRLKIDINEVSGENGTKEKQLVMGANDNGKQLEPEKQKSKESGLEKGNASEWKTDATIKLQETNVDLADVILENKRIVHAKRARFNSNGFQIILEEVAINGEESLTASKGTCIANYTLNMQNITFANRELLAQSATGSCMDFNIELMNMKTCPEYQILAQTSKLSSKDDKNSLNLNEVTIESAVSKIAKDQMLYSKIMAKSATGTIGGLLLNSMTNIAVSEELEVPVADELKKVKSTVYISAVSAKASVEGYELEMENYKSDLNGQAKYESAKIGTEIDFGKEDQDNEDSHFGAEKLHDFLLKGGELDGARFKESIISTDILSIGRHKVVELNTESGVKNRIQSDRLDKELFTQDGFIELKNARLGFSKDEDKEGQLSGKADFKFRAIPYHLVKWNGKEVSGKTVEQDEPEKNVDITINKNGEINGKVEDDVELKRETFGKDISGENLIRTLTLKDAEVSAGKLKASKATLTNGLSMEGKGTNEMDDDIKNVLECTVKGAINHTSSEKPEITNEGIDIKESMLGGVISVEDFLGFLSGSVDAGAGKINVGAKKEVKTPEDYSFLSLEKNYSLPGISVPLAPGVNFEFGVAPAASVGGEVGFELDLGHNLFYEEPTDTTVSTELSGKLAGKASIGVSAGVSAGVPYFANVGVALEAGIEGEFENELKGKAGFGKNENGKVIQKEDFKISDSLAAKLTASLNLKGNVKVLFWKGEIFNLELAKKELASIGFEIAAKKDKDKKHLLEGWELDGGSFTAETFKKGIEVDLKSLGVPETKKTETPEEAAESAWAALQKLKDTNTAVLIDENEKKQAEQDIEDLTKEVKEKVEAYLAYVKNALEEKRQEKEKQEKRKKELEDSLTKLHRKDANLVDINLIASQQGIDLAYYEQREEPTKPSEDYKSYMSRENIMDDEYHNAAEMKKRNKEEDNAAKAKMKLQLKQYKIDQKETETFNADRESLRAVDMAMALMLFNYENRDKDEYSKKKVSDKEVDAMIMKISGNDNFDPKTPAHRANREKGYEVYHPLFDQYPDLTIEEFLKAMCTGKDPRTKESLYQEGGSGVKLSRKPNSKEKKAAFMSVFTIYSPDGNDKSEFKAIEDSLNPLFENLYSRSYTKMMKSKSGGIEASEKRIREQIASNSNELKQSNLDLKKMNDGLNQLEQSQKKYETIMTSLQEDEKTIFGTAIAEKGKAAASLNGGKAPAVLQNRLAGMKADEDIMRSGNDVVKKAVKNVQNMKGIKAPVQKTSNTAKSGTSIPKKAVTKKAQ